MIVKTRLGDQSVQSRVQFTSIPGSWEGGMMGALGITRWADGTGRGYTTNPLASAAVAGAIRLVSESIGTMIMRTYTGDALDCEPVYNSWQARLFQNPSPGLSAFDFWADTAAACETEQAAVIWKIPDPRSGEVAQLLPLDPSYFVIQGSPWDRQVIGFHQGQMVDVSKDVLVVRAWSPKPAAAGVSTLQMHERLFRWNRGYEEYRGRYFDQDGSVNQVIVNGPDKPQARLEMAKNWARVAGGWANAGRVPILWGDAKVEQLSPNLRDAQAAELAIAVAQDVARAYRIVPASLLHAESTPTRETTLEMIRGQFYTFSLMHRIRRIEEAFKADRDIFPDPALYPKFDPTDFRRADMAVIAQAAHLARQDGSMVADEERALVWGLPKLPNNQGQHVQQTPVGGAANQNLPAVPVPAPEEG